MTQAEQIRVFLTEDDIFNPTRRFFIHELLARLEEGPARPRRLTIVMNAAAARAILRFEDGSTLRVEASREMILDTIEEGMPLD